MGGEGRRIEDGGSRWRRWSKRVRGENRRTRDEGIFDCRFDGKCGVWCLFVMKCVFKRKDIVNVNTFTIFITDYNLN